MIRHSIEEQLVLHEGLRTDVYTCPAGKLTIGIGRNLEAVGLFDYEQETILKDRGLTKQEVIDILQETGITPSEAYYLLANDIHRITTELRNEYRWFAFLSDVRKKVVIDMRFNLGRAGFTGFKKMIRQLELENYWNVAEEMVDSKWYSQVGERSKRLVRMMATGQDYSLGGGL